MSKLRRIARTTVRWSWFGLLVLLAFGYLAAGLSEGPQQDTPLIATSDVRDAAELDSVGRDSVGRDSVGGNSVNTPENAQDAEASLLDSASRLDAQWAASLAEQGMKPAEMADWMTVCRRISLAMIGNGLSLEEIRWLEQFPESKRPQVHLNTLLNDSRFHHYWAERWTRFLVGTDGGEFIVYRRRRFRIWLSEVFAANRPYDQMVRDLITAQGLWTDRPEVNFLTSTFDSNDGQPDPVRLAARTSRAFLGLRIDCLQCHNDFLGNVNLGDVDEPREGLQSDFHQLAAFYTSASTSGLQGVRSGEVGYNYKYLNETEESAVEPAVPFLPELLPEDGDPRERLAAWITDPKNRQAARAAVSHVWSLMYGRAIGESVDNLPLDEPPPPMMEGLTDDFVDHGFDVRRLIALIARTSAFRVDSRADFEVTPQHENAGAVFPLVRLRPEQVASTIIQAARIKKTDRNSSLFLQLQTLAGTSDFVRQYGDVGEDEFTTDSVTITQRLLMMNGELLGELVNSNPILNASGHIGMFASENQHAVEIVYLCALNRYPSAAEAEHFVKRFEAAEERGEAIEDLFWVLLNSSELAWNH